MVQLEGKLSAFHCEFIVATCEEIKLKDWTQIFILGRM